MFLAINEIKYDKTRFFLIIFVVVLISYLVFFLTSLAYGLAKSYSLAIDKWDANALVYSKDSNDILSMSMIKKDSIDEVVAKNKTLISSVNAIIKDKSLGVNIISISEDSFIKPKLLEGRYFENANEVVASESLKNEGYKLNDIINFSGEFKDDIKIVGFIEKTTLQTIPVLYSNFSFYKKYRFNDRLDLVNAVLVKDKFENIKVNSSDLKIISIKDYIFKLPGYNAQVLTFSLMIGFLIFISSLVIGIFIYVLTLQKVNMIGVMKAQGVENSYISFYVLSKTLLITIIGVIIGLALILLTSMFLPSKIPFLINYKYYTAIVFLFILFSVFGALFSVRMATKIDPLKAIRA